jgi:hypothetical protein
MRRRQFIAPGATCSALRIYFPQQNERATVVPTVALIRLSYPPPAWRTYMASCSNCMRIFGSGSAPSHDVGV